MKLRGVFFGLCVLVFFGCPIVNADAPPNQIVQLEGDKEGKIITWTPAENLPVTAQVDSGNVVVTVLLKGVLKEKSQTLLIRTDPIPVDSEGKFEVVIPIQQEKNLFKAILIDDLGESNEVEYAFVFPGWADYKEKLAADSKADEEKDTRFHFLPALGLTLINYSQSRVSSTSEFTFIGKLGVTRNLSLTSPLEFGLNLAFTFLPFGSSGDSVVTNKLQFFGGDLHVGMSLPWVHSPWNLKVIGGFYYNTMLGGSGVFGFENALGPELFPVLSRKLENGGVASTYFKFSPVTSGFQFLSLASHEVATGLWYLHKFSKNRILKAMLDFSAWQISYEGITFNYTTIALTVAYHFSY